MKNAMLQRMLFAIAGCLTLSGCSGTPTEEESDEFQIVEEWREKGLSDAEIIENIEKMVRRNDAIMTMVGLDIYEAWLDAEPEVAAEHRIRIVELAEAADRHMSQQTDLVTVNTMPELREKIEKLKQH